MTKTQQTIKIRLPRYEGNHLQWRKAIYEAMIAASTDISIRPDDAMELIVTLYLDRSAITWHDVDNRLKDIMDALQGRVGGPKANKPRHSILPNDNQVYKVKIEKVVAPKQSLGKGRLIVRKYVPRRVSA